MPRFCHGSGAHWETRASNVMNETIRQLLALAPGIGSGLSGNGTGMQAFMDAYQRTQAHLDAQDRTKQQVTQQTEDRQRNITRQAEQDKIAAEDRQRQIAMQTAQLPGVLAKSAEGAETLPDAEQAIDALYRVMAPQLGGVEQLGGVRDVAMNQARTTITRRQKGELHKFLAEWAKTPFAKDAKDADPLVILTPRLASIVGKPEAKLSELNAFTEIPVSIERKPSDDVSLQAKEVMVGGKLTQANYNPKTGTYTDQTGKPITVDPVPPRPTAEDAPILPDDVAGAATAILAQRMAPSQLSLVGGMGNRGVKFKQAVVAEVNKRDPNFNWQSAEAGYQYGKSPGTQTTVRYLDNVAKTIPMLRAANQTFKRSNVRFINNVVKSGKSQFGNVDVADFDFKSTLLADEIAKVLQGGGTGSGTSDAKLRQAQSLLGGDMTPDQFETVLDAAEEMLKVRRQSLTSGTFMDRPETPTPKAPPKIGTAVRDKKTGAVVYVTGVRPDGGLIVSPVKPQ